MEVKVSSEIRMVRVRGVTFENRQELLAVLRQTGVREVILEREPDNPHDCNAIKVMAVEEGLFPTAHHVGYIPREVAAEIAATGAEIKVLAWDIVEGSPLGMGLMVQITKPGAEVVQVPDPGPEKEWRWAQVSDPEPEKERAERWKAVTVTMRGEKWVIVGRCGGGAWAVRQGQAVPKAVTRDEEGTRVLSEAMQAEPAAEVRSLGEAHALYAQAIVA